MSQHLPLLIELGCEELPVKALPGLAQALFDGVRDGLDRRGVSFDREQARLLYTPRRLAVQIDAVAIRQPDQASEVLGPYLNIALDADGQPTKALQGFAAKAGIDWQTLERTTDGKGERFVHRSVKPGAATSELLSQLVEEAINGLPIPKPMRWGDHDYAFVRPVHWLVLLFGDDAVDCQVLGVRSGRQSRGHRFHAPAPIELATPADYEARLHQARVIVDPVVRRSAIAAMVEQAASEAGGTARIDAGILDEVNCLVEWPVPILCSFESDFLRVPQEALILTMETNQKFFPVLDDEGRLTERFIGVANIESGDPAEIRKGYERVIRPRFADARFFYDEDRKQGLASMNAGLAQVTYQAKLGSIAAKAERVAGLAYAIASQLGDVDPELAERAARLSKADLQSRMVNEFPELQGIAGRYYAYEDAALNDLSDTDRAKLALALDEVYMPRNAGDDIATSRLGQVLAIAERLDTLAGGFAAGLKPTGNKDPFALRRNALGLARTAIEASIDVSLDWMLGRAIESVSFAGPVDLEELRSFVIERLRSYYELRGDYDVNLFEAVSAVPEVAFSRNSLVDFDKRLRDLKAFAGSEDGQALAAANKRCGNLLRKAAESGVPVSTFVDATQFESEEEHALANALDQAEAETAIPFVGRDYVAVLSRLAQLRPAVDAFFDNVMVMADDAAIRGNRLALLNRLQQQFLRIADISRLASG